MCRCVFWSAHVSLSLFSYFNIKPGTWSSIIRHAENIYPFQKYGLKVYLRDPSSYTPLIEPGGKNGKARSLLLGRSHEENMKQIAQFSDKDAQVLWSA